MDIPETRRLALRMSGDARYAASEAVARIRGPFPSSLRNLRSSSLSRRGE